MTRTYFLLISIFLFTTALFSKGQDSIVVPGSKGDYTLLPNGWRLTPAGVNIPVGELPMNMVVTRDEKYAITSNSGMGVNSFSVIDLVNKKEVQMMVIDITWRGLCFNKDESVLFVSGGNSDKVYSYNFHNGKLSLKDSVNFRVEKDSLISITGVAYWPQKNYLLAVAMRENSVFVYDLTKKKLVKRIDPGAECYDVIINHKGNYAYISLWGGAKIAVLNIKTLKLERNIKVGDHPCEMIVTKNDRRLFVADANNNSVSVVDLRLNKEIEKINSALRPDAPFGSTPNSVCFNGDESELFIANADNNYVALFDISVPNKSKSLGFIPTGWYPSTVRFLNKNKELVVANGKGLISAANPKGPRPGMKQKLSEVQYIGELFKGTVSVIEYPDAKKLNEYTTQVLSNTPFFNGRKITAVESVVPFSHDSSGSSVIKHVFYIIRENRTYDQILGDILKGNGDSTLCIFPEKITPNAHKLVNEFTLFDNFYADAEVSADGHNWSTAAYASDYTEKVWPVFYGDRDGTYDFEGEKPIASPTSGYIWDNVINHGLKYRNYGEFVEDNAPVYSGRLPQLKNVTYEKYPGFDLDIQDQTRFKVWKEDFERMAAMDSLPSFSLLRLGNDHTSGTRKGAYSINASLADNDYALGEIVETISNSKYWKESIIFVVEDDAQSGSDHVDAHRSVLLVAGTNIKRGYIDHSMYTTSSVLKTMELILGLKPMTQFDLSANPILNPFTDEANLNPYLAVKPLVDINERNIAGLFGGKRCENMDLTVEDAVPETEFNEIIWKAIKGVNSEMPGIVRSAFVRSIEE